MMPCILNTNIPNSIYTFVLKSNFTLDNSVK